jgi:hypothetical protein
MPDYDIANIYKMLDEIRTSLAAISTTTAALNHSVNGNGRPGLEQRMTVQEQILISLSNCVQRHEQQHDKSDGKKLSTIALIFSGVSSAAALLAIILTVIA